MDTDSESRAVAELELLKARPTSGRWVLIVRKGKEPIVKRCNAENQLTMMHEARREYPTAEIFALQTNPADAEQLWADSFAHFNAVCGK